MKVLKSPVYSHASLAHLCKSAAADKLLVVAQRKQAVFESVLLL